MKNIARQILSLILPFTVLILVPRSIEREFTFRLDVLSILGCMVMLLGATGLGITISMFIRIGKGTLAPWSPTRKLVTGSLYAYVRNPMITSVLTGLLGESLFFHSVRIFAWAGIFLVINSVYFVLVEEPGLASRFGDEYLEYKRNVPRWIPRWTPWRPPDEQTG